MGTYIHGYLPDEQQRLLAQAGVLSPLIYPKIDFAGCKHLLEIGSGVGAQTAVLLQLYPDIDITCVDYSENQLETARKNLEAFSDRQIDFILQDARNLKLERNFDSAFICWALEHIAEPKKVLESMKKHLVPGAKVWITEVFNSSFYAYPEMAGLTKYYKAYNEFQINLGGDPDIGAKLGNLLLEAGFSKIQLHPGGFHVDQRNPEQLLKLTQYWKTLMKSATAEMKNSGSIFEEDVLAMERDLDELTLHRDAVFSYQFIQASATI
ncbi:class I SAM-dependent methyltransferase [Algoriphagus sp. CAU 1675]|uniref:class I SAM-dependent methyltransferase n=1 Tax=Algoriphagus sp. CAU 1675 TaxID=3032597 RepID=UPI0023DA9857|nr:class I SAM-dependent methyltransferase [Algoriphagus sp. CAU 1675]MDF2156538.1 class I SAM-dependent methyltransferase [Algoriphagus sp. CAU 1675]